MYVYMSKRVCISRYNENALKSLVMVKLTMTKKKLNIKATKNTTRETKIKIKITLSEKK